MRRIERNCVNCYVAFRKPNMGLDFFCKVPSLMGWGCRNAVTDVDIAEAKKELAKARKKPEGKTESTVKSVCGDCKHACVSYFPYFKPCLEYKFCREANGPVSVTAPACDKYSPTDKSFPVEEPKKPIYETTPIGVDYAEGFGFCPDCNTVVSVSPYNVECSPKFYTCDEWGQFTASRVKYMGRAVKKQDRCMFEMYGCSTDFIHTSWGTNEAVTSISRKQALEELQEKNQQRFKCDTASATKLRKTCVWQNATPEERSGMDKLAEYLLTPRCKKQDKPSSVEGLKNSSTYKCALSEEREAMLERHYELELAGLQQKISMLEKANILTSCSDDKARRELGKVADDLYGKWRVLDKGEPYKEGDLHQIINPDSSEWEWDLLDDLAGDLHDGKDVAIRRISDKELSNTAAK